MGCVTHGSSESINFSVSVSTYPAAPQKTNQATCLALTEKCVEILIVVENEVLEAGADVSADLKMPLASLTSCVFHIVLLII